MDFDQLETFLEVARLSSFSRAAEKRFRTQPAISSQIRALEEEVGAKLLESVIDNSVCFGVFSTPVTDTRLTVMLLHRDELVIIAPPHHPLAKMKSAAVADVAKFPLVLPKAGHTRDALENLFHERRLK